MASEPAIAVVYLLFPNGPRYNRERPIAALKRMLNGLSGRKTIVSVDNAPHDTPYARQMGADEFAISGDNRFREFSGWQKGIDYLRTRGTRADVWLLANDTFLTQSAIQRFMLKQAAIDCAAARCAIVGRRMTVPSGAELMGNLVIPYVRTHLFHLSSVIVERLGSLVSLDEHKIDRLLLDTFDPAIPLFRKDTALSEPARHMIFSHLTRDWYRSRPYTVEHFAELRGKAISILNSLLLSMRIDQLGYPLISFTRAAAFLDEEITIDLLREEWSGGCNRLTAPQHATPPGSWEKPLIYRQIPPKKRSLTLSNLVDLVQSRPGREHM